MKLINELKSFFKKKGEEKESLEENKTWFLNWEIKQY